MKKNNRKEEKEEALQEKEAKEETKAKEESLDKLNHKVESEIKQEIKEHSDEEHCKKEAHIKELTELLQRVHADFINYKKRVQEESKAMAKCASEDVVAKLLPVIDNFELALQHKGSNEEFAKGIELIHSQLLDTLKKEGLTEIKALDHKFDPKEHEALMTEKSDKEDGIVIEEFQKGYKLGDKVIRHSKVKVSRK